MYLPLLCLALLTTSCWAGQGPKHFGLRITSQDVDWGRPSMRRALLRNSSLPLHGAVKEYGYFYASIYLGTPARKFSVIVDTGSTMTYIPCAECGDSCGPNHWNGAFDPAGSNSSARIACGVEDCECGSPACGCSKGTCTYSRSYAEHSSSSGSLVRDVMHLHDGGSPVPITFGCETRETGEIFRQQADGLLGMGRSKASVLNQLAAAGVADNTFSLCLGSVRGEGALVLGDDTVPPGVDMQYTPLINVAAHPFYYNVELKSIGVGGKVLVVSEMADLCFAGAPDYTEVDGLATVFPSMELTFDGGVSLKLHPLNYLFVHTFGTGKYCLGVFDNGYSGTLLGGIMFRNVLVHYDVAGSRVGFGSADCAALGESLRPPCSVFASEAAEAAAADGDCAVEGGSALPPPDPPGAQGASAAPVHVDGQGEGSEGGGGTATSPSSLLPSLALVVLGVGLVAAIGIGLTAILWQRRDGRWSDAETGTGPGGQPSASWRRQPSWPRGGGWWRWWRGPEVEPLSRASLSKPRPFEPSLPVILETGGSGEVLRTIPLADLGK